ncbi:MAG: pyridoxamine 5'-phosphate oxidase family protein [Burkholderiaceae bacterium]
MTIETLAQLRELYGAPNPRALAKQLPVLDRHCRNFIGLSPYVVLATAGADGTLDSSPRGGEPGFVEVIDDGRLLIPDAPGNKRLDSLQNIVETGRIGLLFLIPGVDETLRVNGLARLSQDDALRARFDDAARRPKLVIDVSVRDAYLHCAKSLMRSRLWNPDSRIERSRLPTMGQMLKEQIGMAGEPESQEAMLARYQADL